MEIAQAGRRVVVVGCDVCACLGGAGRMLWKHGVGGAGVSLFFVVFILSGESLLGPSCRRISDIIEYFG